MKAALLDEHYLENELRIEHLARALDKGLPVRQDVLRDPVRYDRDRFWQLRAERQAGRVPDGDEVVAHYPLASMGRVGLDQLESNIDLLRSQQVQGNVVELGAGRGGSGIFVRAYLDTVEDWESTLFVVDSFDASEGGAVVDEPPDLNTVRDGYEWLGLLDDHVRFLIGMSDATAEAAPFGPISLLLIGRRPGSGLVDAVHGLYPHLADGGVIMVEDLDDPDVAEAMDTVIGPAAESGTMNRFGLSGGWWQKQATTREGAGPTDVAESASSAPSGTRLIEPSPPGNAVDLTVVVVVYEMQRAAERTLQTLSRSYQEGIEDLSYEVIVVENGSAPDRRLGGQVVESFGPEFRYLDLGEDARPSPVGALNRGVAAGRGRAFALMIDGAHLLTPGVLRYGMRGLREEPPSITAFRHWYLGPGQQDRTVGEGYDETYEDELLSAVHWPAHGYGLFDIGHFIGERDWLDELYESNCLFVERSVLARYGCFDESFVAPGGGYANLDLFERLDSAADLTTVTVIGEATFHQVHGGVTTNVDRPEKSVRQTVTYDQQYRELRGRSFHTSARRLRFIGAVVPGSVRSRARRATPRHFFERRAPGVDGLPDKPTIVPEDLERDFTEAYWRSLAWRGTEWLGHTTGRPPSDLFAYQEVIAAVHPDWILHVAAGPSGVPYYLATLCDLLDHGRVVSICQIDGNKTEDHPRVHTIVGRPSKPAVKADLETLLGPEPRAVAIIGGRMGRAGVLADFEAVVPFVPVGSYIIVEDTVLNGHPAWRNFGAGPGEAVAAILADSTRFAPDLGLERSSATFNPRGFLRRMQ